MQYRECNRLFKGIHVLQLKNLIASNNNRLTPTERKIAKVILSDPTLLSFGTVSALAELVGTSRASIVRFATKLGFAGYSELQQSVRAEVSAQLTKPTQRIRHDDSVEPMQSIIEKAVHTSFGALSGKRLKELASPIATAKNVWIISGETSMCGAVALASGLSMIRPNVRLVQEHSSSRELCGALVTDVAVVFDFSRYRRNSIVSARMLAKQGVPIIAITDGPLSPLASLTELRCELDIPAVGPFDSSVPAVIAAELLVSQVVVELGESAMQRIDQLETHWQANDTFLE